MCKVFKAETGGKKVALDGLTLDVAENQITALLGHNGAMDAHEFAHSSFALLVATSASLLLFTQLTPSCVTASHAFLSVPFALPLVMCCILTSNLLPPP